MPREKDQGRSQTFGDARPSCKLETKKLLPTDNISRSIARIILKGFGFQVECFGGGLGASP